MVGEAMCVDIAADDVPALTAFAQEKGIDLVVPGPEPRPRAVWASSTP